MEPLENAEELVIVLHIETRSVVFYAIDGFSSLDFALDLDYCRLIASREFNGIGQEIRENLPNERLVPEPFGSFPFVRSSLRPGFAEACSCQIAFTTRSISILFLNMCPTGSGKIKQIAYQTIHPGSIVPDNLNFPVRLWTKLLRIIQEHPGEAFDCPEWCPKIV